MNLFIYNIELKSQKIELMPFVLTPWKDAVLNELCVPIFQNGRAGIR